MECPYKFMPLIDLDGIKRLCFVDTICFLFRPIPAFD